MKKGKVISLAVILVLICAFLSVSSVRPRRIEDIKEHLLASVSPNYEIKHLCLEKEGTPYDDSPILGDPVECHELAEIIEE